ncbi:uncharacterized protein LOC119999356 [Tripterygium wilfordii]|uniref:uncharacterized protein LOC119999356 n=1 Tax=Tripterygium wilfordii TaxID=458696 RepID=UPI0018F81FB5|nr:uncharacterized protein LOC119999356 [Tripterygium wilfordii]
MRFFIFSLLKFFILAPTLVSSHRYKKYEEAAMIVKKINKAALLTIESPDGDLIDCIDERTQPAFDHPLLRNHKIRSVPKQWLKQKSGELRKSINEASQIWLRNETRCPKHSVPIRRTTIADVMRTNFITQVDEKQNSNYHKLTSKSNVHQYATVIHKAPEGVYGAKARLNVWQPFVEGIREFSLAQIWIIAGPDDEDLNSIEVGWHVYPWLYGDNATRFFIFWTKDRYQTGKCYNIQNCPGFVQKTDKMVVGAALETISQYNDTQYDITVLIRKDQKKGDWWLTVGETVVGYWPADIFTRLKGAATRVEWGGEVINTATTSRGRHTKTQMGSGHFADEGYKKASYFDGLEMVTKDDVVIPVKTVSKEVTNDQCYNILVYPYDDEFGTGFLYGGPGFNESTCKE